MDWSGVCYQYFTISVWVRAQSSEQPHQYGPEQGAEAEPRHQPEQQQRARQLLVLQRHLHNRAVNEGSQRFHSARRLPLLGPPPC